MNRLPISFFAIVHNESTNEFVALLRGIKPIVEEMIVVEQGNSRDGTAHLAEACGARIVHDKLHGFMEPSIQLAVDNCRMPWVLQLDADEMPTEWLIDNLPWLVSAPFVNGYCLHRQNFVGGHRSLNPNNPADLQTRLYRKSAVVDFPGLRIHRNVTVREPVLHLHEACIIHRKSSERDAANAERYKNLLASGRALPIGATV